MSTEACRFCRPYSNEVYCGKKNLPLPSGMELKVVSSRETPDATYITAKALCSQTGPEAQSRCSGYRPQLRPRNSQ